MLVELLQNGIILFGTRTRQRLKVDADDVILFPGSDSEGSELGRDESSRQDDPYFKTQGGLLRRLL